LAKFEIVVKDRFCLERTRQNENLEKDKKELTKEYKIE